MKSIIDDPEIQELLELEKILKKQQLVLYMKPISSATNRTVISEGKTYIMLGSYSYLGLINHPQVIDAALQAIKKYGTGAGGVRLLTGTTDLHLRLEKKIAEFKRTEDAILYSSGYVTNMTIISTLFKKGDLIIIDKYDHQSIYDGCMLSKAEWVRFDHNNIDHLQDILEEKRTKYRKVLIAVDGVYSMDGDIAPLPEILELAKQYDSLTMVDEAHAIGAIGANGRGVDEYFGLEPNAIDIYMGTLSKAIPSVGGYVAGKKEMISYLRYKSHAFIFSAALPPANTAAALKALEIMETEKERVEKLQSNIHYFLKQVKELGYNTLKSKDTPIIPVIIGDDMKTFQFAKELWDAGIFVPPVVYPAVPKNSGRLRCCIMATHTKEDLDYVIEKLGEIGRKLGVI